MIKHIVCYKFKDNSPRNIKLAADALLSMRGVVPEALSIEVGADFLGSERYYDLVLEVRLESKSALESYQKNQFHCQEVKPIMHSLTEKSVSVDFECGEF